MDYQCSVPRKMAVRLQHEMVSTVTNAGFSETAVRSYFAGRASESGYGAPAEDITESQINEIKQSVGGDQTVRKRSKLG